MNKATENFTDFKIHDVRKNMIEIEILTTNGPVFFRYE